MTTGQRMKERRKLLALSAEQVAAEMGVSPATIYRYEKGDIEKIPGKMMEPLAEMLQTTPAYLMGWTDDPENYENAPELDSLPLEWMEYFNGDMEAAVKAYRALDEDRRLETEKKPIPEDELDSELITLLSVLTPHEVELVSVFVSGLIAAREGRASRGS